MNNKGRLGAAVLALVMVMLLCACGSGKGKDVPVDDVVAAVDEALGKDESLVAVDENYIKGDRKSVV